MDKKILSREEIIQLGGTYNAGHKPHYSFSVPKTNIAFYIPEKDFDKVTVRYLLQKTAETAQQIGFEAGLAKQRARLREALGISQDESLFSGTKIKLS